MNRERIIIFSIFSHFWKYQTPYTLASMTLALSCMCTGSLQRQKCFILCEEQYLPGTSCTMFVIIAQFSFLIGAPPLRSFWRKQIFFIFLHFYTNADPIVLRYKLFIHVVGVEAEQRLMVEL